MPLRPNEPVPDLVKLPPPGRVNEPLRVELPEPLKLLPNDPPEDLPPENPPPKDLPPNDPPRRCANDSTGISIVAATRMAATMLRKRGFLFI